MSESCKEYYKWKRSLMIRTLHLLCHTLLPTTPHPHTFDHPPLTSPPLSLYLLSLTLYYFFFSFFSFLLLSPPKSPLLSPVSRTSTGRGNENGFRNAIV